ALGRLVPGAVLLDRSALDVTDRAAVAGAVVAHHPEVIVHAAAYTRVDAAEANSLECRAVNVSGTEAVAEAAGKVGALLVYPSTDYVFPGEKMGAYREEDATGPLSVYGRTKLEGERVAAGHSPHLIVRTSWVFGEGHNFVRTILAAASRHAEIRVVDDQRGLPTYAPDLAAGIVLLLERGASGTYHLAGGGEAASWAELASAALKAAGSAVRVRPVSTSEYDAGRSGPFAARPANGVLDCTKAEKIGVWLRPWREALAGYVRGGT
ncbi:MAG: dTDP-4-dehydrorhamnose reductase, partial [Actinomycetota bacterium]